MIVSFLFLARGIGCESEIHDVTNCYKNSIVHAVLGFTLHIDLGWIFCTVHVGTYLTYRCSTARAGFGDKD